MNKFTGNYEPSLTGLTPLQASTTEETTTKSHHLSVIAISNCFFLNIWVEDPYFPTNYIFLYYIVFPTTISLFLLHNHKIPHICLPKKTLNR